MSRILKPWRSIERLEQRRFLTAFGYVAHSLVEEAARLTAVIDVDSDGDADILSGDTKISWRENLDGKGTFADPIHILTNLHSVRNAFGGDIDSDGDKDLIGLSSNRLVWFENLDESTRFGAEKIIASDIPVNPHQFFILFGDDADGDGDTDIFFGGRDQRLELYTSDKGQFSEPIFIATDGGAVASGDVDSDNDMDLIVTSKNGPVFWENVNGQGSFENRGVVLHFEEFYANRLALGDMDGDGHLDILAANFLDIRILRNLGNGNEYEIYSTTKPHDTDIVGLSAGDFNSDGAYDILAMEFFDGSQRPAVHVASENGTQFTKQTLGETSLFPTVISNDVDSDGGLDILTGIHGKIITQYSLSNDIETAITAPHPFTPTQAIATDIDGDSDLDLFSTELWYGCDIQLTHCGDELTTFENLDGNATFSERKVLFNFGGEHNPSVYEFVDPIDMDGDGDQDLISLSYPKHSRWYENTDGQGTMQANLLPFDEDFGQVTPFDFDSDGDIDLITNLHSAIGLTRNLGNGKFADPERLIEINDSWFENGMIVSNLDDDDDVEILARVRTKTETRFVRIEKSGNAYELKEETIEPADQWVRFDIDNNGEKDLITVDRGTMRVYGKFDGEFMLQQELMYEHRKFITQQHTSLQLIDLDNDGAEDVLIGGLVWFRFLAERNEFAATSSTFPFGDLRMAAGDFDNDGDTDLFNGQAWFEHRPAGDSNGDGRFDSADLVEVFQINEFEDDLNLNSTFVEGDWNNDGDFNSADLVFAFEGGTYVNDAITHEIAGRVVDDVRQPVVRHKTKSGVDRTNSWSL